MRFPTILLVEDEPIISLEIRYILEENGFLVIQATELKDVTDACALHQPVLAILNFKQQDHPDGMALARLLKRRFMLPLMFITGARPRDIAASEDFDTVLDILYKPFTRAQLRRFVQQWLT